MRQTTLNLGMVLNRMFTSSTSNGRLRATGRGSRGRHLNGTICHGILHNLTGRNRSGMGGEGDDKGRPRRHYRLRQYNKRNRGTIPTMFRRLFRSPFNNTTNPLFNFVKGMLNIGTRPTRRPLKGTRVLQRLRRHVPCNTTRNTGIKDAIRGVRFTRVNNRFMGDKFRKNRRLILIPNLLGNTCTIHIQLYIRGFYRLLCSNQVLLRIHIGRTSVLTITILRPNMGNTLLTGITKRTSRPGILLTLPIRFL